jgi:hypothetical protein
MATPMRLIQSQPLSQFEDPGDSHGTSSPLKAGDGGGTYGGMPPDLPERVAVLETHIEHINKNIGIIQQDIRDIRGDMKTDFRVTWAGLFIVALGLAGMMAKGFKWI